MWKNVVFLTVRSLQQQRWLQEVRSPCPHRHLLPTKVLRCQCDSIENARNIFVFNCPSFLKSIDCLELELNKKDNVVYSLHLQIKRMKKTYSCLPWYSFLPCALKPAKGWIWQTLKSLPSLIPLHNVSEKKFVNHFSAAVLLRCRSFEISLQLNMCTYSAHLSVQCGCRCRLRAVAKKAFFMVSQVHIDNQPHIQDQDYLSRGKWLLSPQYQGPHRHSSIWMPHYVVKETKGNTVGQGGLFAFQRK